MSEYLLLQPLLKNIFIAVIIEVIFAEGKGFFLHFCKLFLELLFCVAKIKIPDITTLKLYVPVIREAIIKGKIINFKSRMKSSPGYPM